METTQRIIASMNKEDIRHFKLYSTRMEYDYDRKDLQLFNLMKKEGEEFNDVTASKKLYPHGNRNAFYRMKHRLLNHLNKSLLLQYMDSNDNIEILTSFSLYHFHYSRNSFETAHYFLKKAERKAKQLESLELLDMIYSEFIKLFNVSVDFNPEEYIKLQQENAMKLVKLRQINQVLAMVSYRLKLSQNYGEGNQKLIQLLEKTMNDFSGDKEVRKSKVLRLRLINVVCQSLLQHHNYKTLETYLSKEFGLLMKEKFFNKTNHDNKLQMLTYLVNSKFKTQKYNESIQYADKLKQAMAEFDGMLKEKYLIFYTNALVMNYSITNPLKAIEILEETLRIKSKQQGYYEMFVLLNLGILYFETMQFEKSIKCMIKLSVTDSFKKADRVLQLKVSIGELMIRFDLKEWDVLDYRIAQVKRNFTDLLKQEKFLREREMLLLIKSLNGKGGLKLNDKLQSRIKALIKQMSKSTAAENDVIKYVPWLQGKL